MKILVTGSYGFIGKNVCLRLMEQPGNTVITFGRKDSVDLLKSTLTDVDAVIHLAGENRHDNPEVFKKVNTGLTEVICHELSKVSRKIPLILASSTQASIDNPYGLSKLAAEKISENLSVTNGNPVAIYRLPGVFGKWGKPHYNSVVATFCYNIANEMPVRINDPSRVIDLVYVEDVVDSFIGWLNKIGFGCQRLNVAPQYSISLKSLAEQIVAFKNCRTSLVSENVGAGLVRALYSTYVSYLPKEKFVYDLPMHADSRGLFVEMLKTKESGQFSFFTAYPGITRGGHYHHTKTEKFLVVKGKARFGFRRMDTDEKNYLYTSEDKPQVVESVPGWTHDITNIGSTEMIVMLWANEIFDRDNPDTIECKVENEEA